jgi:hypothetical protein
MAKYKGMLKLVLENRFVYYSLNVLCVRTYIFLRRLIKDSLCTKEEDGKEERIHLLIYFLLSPEGWRVPCRAVEGMCCYSTTVSRAKKVFNLI